MTCIIPHGDKPHYLADTIAETLIAAIVSTTKRIALEEDLGSIIDHEA
jgi:hypothetical protein